MRQKHKSTEITVKASGTKASGRTLKPNKYTGEAVFPVLKGRGDTANISGPSPGGAGTDIKGSSYVTVCVLICALFIVFIAIWSFAGAVSVVSETARCARVSLDRTVTSNAPVIYASVKTGGSAGAELVPSEYVTYFADLCSLVPDGDRLCRLGENGEELFSVTVPTLGFYVSPEELDAVTEFSVRVRIFGPAFAEVPVRIRSALGDKTA